MSQIVIEIGSLKDNLQGTVPGAGPAGQKVA